MSQRKSSLTILFCRGLLFLSLFLQIRTSESESSAEFLVRHERRKFHDQQLDGDNHPHRHSNAIMRANTKARHSSATAIGSSSNSRSEINQPHHSQFNFVRSEAVTLPPGCPNCGNQGSVPDPVRGSAPLPDDVLRSMRLEMVKQQILKKLRMTKPPEIPESYQKELQIPEPLGDTLHKIDHNQQDGDKNVEDFYGKTEQIIVFPEEASSECLSLNNQDPSSCYRFLLPDKIRHEEIASVQLWVYKLPDPNDVHKNQTFYVKDVVKAISNSDEYNPTLLRTKSDINITLGWISLNITNSASSWLRLNKFDHTFQIGCPTCVQYKDGVDLGSPVGSEGEERPFVVFNMAENLKKRRTRRHINCSPGVTECCREHLVVNFKEIGWHFVKAPSSFNTYMCKGSCHSVSSNSNTRTSILMALNSKNSSRELIPCCTATKMSSISLVISDGNSNSTGTLRVETLPNMVVESCGCN